LCHQHYRAFSTSPVRRGPLRYSPVFRFRPRSRAGDGTAFCLNNGVQRMQVIRPKPHQSFHEEGQTVLNGSRLLRTFSRDERYWMASGQEQRGRRRGQCAKEFPACNLLEGLFIDDKPLAQVLTKQGLEAGQFYFDHAGVLGQRHSRCVGGGGH
jgi:hypothetical protein